ncbi:hypothetical protein D3C77_54390 [compost metagenome]|jgi:hypothetical protein
MAVCYHLLNQAGWTGEKVKRPSHFGSAGESAAMKLGFRGYALLCFANPEGVSER